jgi:hypothetical protein
MSAGLAHLEQVYQRERNTQQNLLQEAQRLESPGNEGRNSWHSSKESLSGSTTRRVTDSSDAKTGRMCSSTILQFGWMDTVQRVLRKHPGPVPVQDLQKTA